MKTILKLIWHLFRHLKCLMLHRNEPHTSKPHAIPTLELRTCTKCGCLHLVKVPQGTPRPDEGLWKGRFSGWTDKKP